LKKAVRLPPPKIETRNRSIINQIATRGESVEGVERAATIAAV